MTAAMTLRRAGRSKNNCQETDRQFAHRHSSKTSIAQVRSGVEMRSCSCGYMRACATLIPVGGENIEFVALLGILVGCENDLFSVGGELGEGGEAAEVGDLFQAGTVSVDQIQFEAAAVAIVLVGGKKDFLAIRGESGGEAGAAEIGDLFDVFAVGIGDVELHLHRRGEVLRQQRAILLQALRRSGVIGSPNKLLAVA